jgi:(2R)-3-sulfolactate dehydrogenase (NADP+)
MADKLVRIPVEQARAIATAACVAAGADPAMTQSLVEATLSAAQFGRHTLGFPHLLDYLAGIREGRIRGDARPSITYPLPAVIASDAMGGIAQLGFDLAFADLCSRARSLGIAIFMQRNSFTTGELGYYVRRLALDGLIGLAVNNGPVLMAAAPGQPRVYCTNPMAFAAPMPGGQRPLVIDQASSATAFLNLKKAAAEGRTIPEGWAIDRAGRPTTDAKAAVEGALLPFGGYKGANIALLVEILSAGLSGASWSMDARPYASGDQCPDCGLTVVAVSAPETRFSARLAAQLRRLQGQGVSIPSQREAVASDEEIDSVLIAERLMRQLQAYPST